METRPFFFLVVVFRSATSELCEDEGLRKCWTFVVGAEDVHELSIQYTLISLFLILSLFHIISQSMRKNI